MDKIAELLAEAKPLYKRRKQEKFVFVTTCFSLILALGVWLYQPVKVSFDEDGFDTYFTALYLSDVPADEIIDDGIIPLDCFGLVKV